MPSLDSPSSSANFLPSKRAPVRELVPSSFLRVTAAVFCAGALRSTTFPAVLAMTVLPCRMLTSTLGPLPSHWSLYSPGFSLVPFTMVGLFRFRVALVDANALEAINTANPMVRVFTSVENFIAAPSFFPEITSGNGWGGPARDLRKKTLVFPHESPKMHALGLSNTGHNPALP